MAVFKRSGNYVNYSCGDDGQRSVRVKKCVVSQNPNQSPRMEGDCDYDNKDVKVLFDDTKSRRSSLVTCNISSASKESFKDFKRYPEELKSFPVSLQTWRGLKDSEREEIYKSWCAKKDQEKKLKQEKTVLMQRIREKERELLMQLERENFKRWLARKKREEEIRKKTKEKEIENEKLKRDQRLRENELTYQLWLKKKEEAFLEKKIQEHTALLMYGTEKQEHLQKGVHGYDEWRRSTPKSRSKRHTRELLASKSTILSKPVQSVAKPFHTCVHLESERMEHNK